jgi:hypothetical protein
MRKLVAILSVSALVAGGATGTALANNGKGKGSGGPGGGKSCQSHGPKGKTPKGCPPPAPACDFGPVTGALHNSPLGATPLDQVFCALGNATGGAL